MTFVDYLNLIRRRLPLVGAIVGVVSLISLGMSMRQEPLYEAALRLRTRPIAPLSPANNFLEQVGVQQDLATEAQLIASEKVASIVVEDLGLTGKPGDLLEAVDVFPVEGTSIIAIRSKAAHPQFAMDLANGFAEAYLSVRRDEAGRVIDQAVQQASSSLADAQQRLVDAGSRQAASAPGSVAAAEAEAERNLALADVVAVRSLLRDLADRSAIGRGFGEVISPADEADLLSSTDPVRSVTFGALLGIPLALAVILLLDSMSETVRTATDAELITGTDVVGLIPFDDRIASYGPRAERRGRHRRRHRRAGQQTTGALAVGADPFSLVSEAYRTASLNLTSLAQAHGCGSILVTSALAGEGKTTTLCNLAASTAEQAQEVLLVDADLRRPAAHALVGAPAEPGLAEVVDGGITPRKAVQAVQPHFSFVASGAPVERPDQLLTRINVAQVLNRFISARGQARAGKGNGNGNGNGNGRTAGRSDTLVFLDSAPVLQATETLALARAVDGVVLVVRAGVTRRQAVTRAVEQVRRSGGTLLGVLLVGVSNEVHLGLGGSDQPRSLALVRDGLPDDSGAAFEARQS